LRGLSLHDYNTTLSLLRVILPVLLAGTALDISAPWANFNIHKVIQDFFKYSGRRNQEKSGFCAPWKLRSRRPPSGMAGPGY